jgi:hypothetical protein
MAGLALKIYPATFFFFRQESGKNKKNVIQFFFYISNQRDQGEGK